MMLLITNEGNIIHLPYRDGAYNLCTAVGRCDHGVWLLDSNLDEWAICEMCESGMMDERDNIIANVQPCGRCGEVTYFVFGDEEVCEHCWEEMEGRRRMES